MVIPSDQISEVCEGLSAIGQLSRCDAVLSGYMGSAEQGGHILSLVDRVKQANPKAIYCCDPVMGHPEKGCIVAPGVMDFLTAEAVAKADIVCPNVLELGTIAAMELRNVADVVEACRKVLAMGPKVVFVKHLSYAGYSADHFEMLVASTAEEDCWHISTPLLPFTKAPVGVGDLTSGVFLSHFLHGKTLKDSLESTTNAYFGVMETTYELGEYELQVVAAQDLIAKPTHTFSSTVVNSAPSE